MKIFNWNLNEKLNTNDDLIMCLGGFESLHLGHNELFKLAKSYKNDNPNSKLAISIFANSIKNNEVIEKKLLQLKVRLYILANLDFDYVFIITPNKEIINISDNKFIEELKKMNIKTIICGQDYRFGFNHQGDISKLKKCFNVHVANEKKVNHSKISTHLIKELISEGNINYANELLLEKYALIIKADKFIFHLPENIIKIKSGIYVVNAIIKDIEYHGLCLISKYSNDNKLYLFDITTIPSKHQEIYTEFLGAIRYIDTKQNDNINDKDLKIAKKYLESI